MSSVPNLDFLFNPRSVAVVGVSGDGDEANSGRRYVQSMVNCGFRGPIYAVNNSGGEMDGAMIYSSVRDIPHSVDFVISAIPAQFTPQLVADCAARGVKAIHFFSSGFAEIEDKRGRQLESEILSLARQSGIRIVGPNCMGLYCPGSGLSFCKDFPRQRGPLAVIAQSGGKSYHFIREASTRGLYLSKVISYGNAIDVDECDFLEYFADDPETKVICTYTEGVRDGRRFARALRKITGAKPVIMYKAGTTDDGIRIVASHTNSLAGSSRIWQGFMKQHGVIQADSVEETVDSALLFLRMPVPGGKNVGIIGVGGGTSVQATDECVRAGLAVPLLPKQTRVTLSEIYGTEAGRIFRNPVDLNMFIGPQIVGRVVKAVAECEAIDLLLMHVGFDTLNLTDSAERRDLIWLQVEFILSLKGMVAKPVAVVMHSQATDEDRQLSTETQARLNEAGFVVFPSFRRAAAAISRHIWYQSWRGKNRHSSEIDM